MLKINNTKSVKTLKINAYAAQQITSTEQKSLKGGFWITENDVDN